MFVSIAGNDRIDARDGVREQLNCGPGADTAIVDTLDVVPNDPGSLCEAVQRKAAGAGPSVRSSSLRLRRGRIATTVACPAGSATCRGRVTVRTHSRVKLGERRQRVTVATRSFTARAGRSVTVRLRPSASGRRLLARVRRVRVDVSVTPTAGEAVTRTVTLRR
jgi:hypothetical protein